MSININVRYSFSTGVSSLVLFRMATKISLRPEILLRDLAFSGSWIMLLPRDMSDSFHRSDTLNYFTQWLVIAPRYLWINCFLQLISSRDWIGTRQIKIKFRFDLMASVINYYSSEKGGYIFFPFLKDYDWTRWNQI